MSTSARRLTSAVPTDRFHWQRRHQAPGAGEQPVMPVFSATPRPETIALAPALRERPSPSAERLEAAEREAFARGYDEGRRDGVEAMTARTEAALANLQSSLATLQQVRAGVMHRAERESVQLALSIAEQILHRTVAADPTVLVEMARQAIDRIGSTVATIRLHPDDLTAVSPGLADAPASGVEIVADPTIQPGGCLVQSSFGTIDAGIDAQIRELARALLDGRDEGEPSDGSRTGV